MILLQISNVAVGIVAGVFTAIAQMPQLFKLLKEKKSENVSIFVPLILLCGLGLWVWYGARIEDWPIMITNIFSLVVNALVLFFTIRYK